MTDSSIPTYDSMMNPVIEGLQRLGGSGTIAEINEEVFEILGLSDEQLDSPHDPEKGSATEVEYRLHWTRTHLKKYGILENSSRGCSDPQNLDRRERTNHETDDDHAGLR
jgi:restriction system protein